MSEFVARLTEYFEIFAQISVTLLEFIGIVVLVIGALKAVVNYFRRNDHLRLDFAQAIALSLEFKLGGEILRTTIVRDWSELGILGAIILLRAAMTLLIHWEIKNEEARCKEYPPPAGEPK